MVVVCQVSYHNAANKVWSAEPRLLPLLKLRCNKTVMTALAALWVFVEGRTVYASKKIRLLDVELKAAREGLLQAQKEYYAGEIGRSTYASRSDASREKQRTATAQLRTWRDLQSKYARKTIFARFSLK